MLGFLVGNSVNAKLQDDGDALLVWATWHSSDPKPTPESGRLSVLKKVVEEAEKILAEQQNGAKEGSVPVEMALTCPECGLEHEDVGEWATRPHKTHLCLHCGHEWRPHDYPTVGVEWPDEKKPSILRKPEPPTKERVQ